MKKKLLLLLINLPLWVSAQVVLNQIDDFEDFTMRNWTKNNSIPNSNIYDGGPMGTGDNFLRVTSSGTGTNLNLMTFNIAQWIGNYHPYNGLTNRVKYISMDVRNSGDNIIFLRMSFRYTTSSNNNETWSAINAVAVLPGEGWKKISFYIDQSAMVRLTGLNAFTTAFSDIEEVRILHNDAPAWESDPIVATLDIDNISADSQLSVEDFQESDSLHIYPNPSNNYFSIYSENNLYQFFEYKIIDLTGRVVKYGTIDLNEKIDVENLTSGNYIVQIQTEDGLKFIKKLVKN